MPLWYITHMDKEAKIAELLRELQGASEDDDLLEVDARNRLSLGNHATHRRYLVTDLGDGMLLLTPVVVIPAVSLEAVRLKIAQEERSEGIKKRHAARGVQTHATE